MGKPVGVDVTVAGAADPRPATKTVGSGAAVMLRTRTRLEPTAAISRITIGIA